MDIATDKLCLVLRDMIDKAPCVVDTDMQSRLVARFGHPEAFTREGLKDEFLIDNATGIRTRRTMEERIIWRFNPSGQLLDELKTLCGHSAPADTPVKAIVVGVEEQVKNSFLQSIKSTFGRIFSKRKTGRAAFSREAMAKLCAVSDKTIYNWETGKTSPEIDGYSEALRINGGAELFAWVEDYRRFKQQPQLSKILTHKNIAFLDGITEKDKELIQEYIRTHRAS